MEPGMLFCLLLVGGLYLLAGMCCVGIWEDVFNDISFRPLRALARILMLFLWPVWLAFWAVCVGVAIFCMAVEVLLE